MNPNPTLPLGQVTRLLDRIHAGDERAREELVELVYEDLRVVARRQCQGQRGGVGGGALQPTALVHETYLRLLKQRQRFDNRAQFFKIAATLMIRVLRDHHREVGARKRGGDRERITLGDDLVAASSDRSPSDQAIAVLDALERLEAIDARKAEVVKLRVLFGLTHPEIAEALAVGKATVDRDWQFARAWLLQQAGTTGETEGEPLP